MTLRSCASKEMFFGARPLMDHIKHPRLDLSTREVAASRAVIDRQTVHVHDIREAEDQGFIKGYAPFSVGESRTLLAVPLLREDVAIGVILIRRFQVHPFSDKQIALLKTFADQAVIAIENVRLFKEFQERNAELREALEHQTATAEVLGIISRSPTDVQPVLDAIVESAARVCGIDDVVLRLREGNSYGSAGSFWSHTHWPRSRSVLMSHGIAGCASMARSTFPMSRAQNDFPRLGSAGGSAHLFSRSASPAGGTHWNTDRTSHRGAPLHPGADQAARNLRRPGSDRHRERAAVSTNSRSRWSSRRRRVRSWVSSPARRRIFSRCWMWSRRMLRDYATRTMHRFALVDGDMPSDRWPTTDRLAWRRWTRSTNRPWLRYSAEPWLTGK